MITFLMLFLALGRLYGQMLKQPETRALLITAALLLIVGVGFYSLVERWSVLNAIYFCVVTLGTVGYGDITPTTDAGRLFTVIYIMVGQSVIGGFFATLGRLIDPQRMLSLRIAPPGIAKEREELAKERERLARVMQRDEAKGPPPGDDSRAD